MRITAIPTKYNGYQMRSRLEARWAYFFDQIGLNWEYEPDAFDVGTLGRYLPDFKVVTREGYTIYYEIKPRNHGGSPKAIDLGNILDDNEARVVNLCGDPYEVFADGSHGMCPGCGTIHKKFEWNDVGHETDEAYCYVCDVRKPYGVSDFGIEPKNGVLNFHFAHNKGFTQMDSGRRIAFEKSVAKFAENARAKSFSITGKTK